mgnify:FL=1|jgi:Rieske Fe-S protein
MMNKLTFYIVLLHSLFLGIGTAGAQSLETEAEKKMVTSAQLTLPASKIWVLHQNKQVQKQAFMWVVDDPQKAREQPFLEIAQTAKKLTKKPTNSVKPGKEDELEAFDEVVKDCQN